MVVGTWQDLTDTEENAGYKCFKMARLMRDDGTWLGSVMQFYEGGPAYPLTPLGRLGPHQTWEFAVKAIEEGRRPRER